MRRTLRKLTAWSGLLVCGLAACKRPAPPSPPAMATSAAQVTEAPRPVAPAAPAGPKVAAAENRRGMGLYRTKDYAGAAAAFRAAIAAEPTHVLAHYNLACVLALTGDAPGAIAMLEWLAGSPSAQAARCLTKAAVDRDLTSVRGDAKVRALLAAAAAKAAAAVPTDDKLLPPMPTLIKEVQASATAADAKNAARYAARSPLFFQPGGGPGLHEDSPAFTSRWCVSKPDGGIGESLQITLSSPSPIDKLRVAAGVWESAALFQRHNRVSRLEVMVDGQPPQSVPVPGGRRYAELRLGKTPVSTIAIRIAAVERGQENLSCLSAVQLYRDDLPEDPLDVSSDPALSELPGALLAIQKALRAPGRDFAALDSLLAFPFTTSDGSCFLSMECDSSKEVTHKSLSELAKACRSFERLSDAKRESLGNPCPSAASVDGDDSRPMIISRDARGRVTIGFPSHNEVSTQWKLVHREGSWRLSEIGFTAGGPDDSE